MDRRRQITRTDERHQMLAQQPERHEPPDPVYERKADVSDAQFGRALGVVSRRNRLPGQLFCLAIGVVPAITIMTVELDTVTYYSDTDHLNTDHAAHAAADCP